MSRVYTVHRDGDLFIAQHRSDPSKNVRVNPDWVTTEEDNIYAPWEDIIHSIVSEDLTQYVDISSTGQSASIPLDLACENMVSSGIAESEAHARGVLECLDKEDILEIENDNVVLFTNPTGENAKRAAIYNWAAVVEAATNKIEDQIERAEKMDEQLQKKLEQIDDIGPSVGQTKDAQEQINEIYRELKSLDSDAETVHDIDPTDLPPDKQNRYHSLKRSFRIAQSRQKIGANETVDLQGEDIDEWMSNRIGNFKELRQAFYEYQKDLRTVVAYKEWNNNNVADLLDNLVDMISGVALIDQSIQDQNHEEFASQVEAMAEEVEESQQYREGIESVQDEQKREQVGQEMESRQQQTQSQQQSQSQQQNPYAGPPDEDFGNPG